MENFDCLFVFIWMGEKQATFEEKFVWTNWGVFSWRWIMVMGTTFISLVLVSRRVNYLSNVAMDMPLSISKYLNMPLNSLPIDHELYVAQAPSPIFVMSISKLHKKKLDQLKLKGVATP